MEGSEVAAIVRQESGFFINILKMFLPEHAGYKPADELWTVTAHINHIADTVCWAREGLFGAGFEAAAKLMQDQTDHPNSLDQAMDRLKHTYNEWITFLESKSTEELDTLLPANPLFGIKPKWHTIYECAEHTAHHRGALCVYLRILGIAPGNYWEE